MNAKLEELFLEAKQLFLRLSQKEQLIVGSSIGGMILIILLSIQLSISSKISKTEHRLQVKTQSLKQIINDQYAYKLNKAEQEVRLQTLRQANFRLVSLVEDIARKRKVEVGQLRPEDGEPNADGILESRVDLRANNLSADKLQAFLADFEQTQMGMVFVRRLKINRPYRRDTVDLELTVTTYKAKR